MYDHIRFDSNYDIKHFVRLWQLSEPSSKVDTVHIVSAFTWSDYWVYQEKFCEDFLQVPPDKRLLVHTIYEGLSMTASGLQTGIDQLVKMQNRDPNSVKIYSPNALHEDCTYENLFFYDYNYCDDINTMQYWAPSVNIDIDDQLKTWALFVGRKNMPRMLAMFDTHNTEHIRSQTLFSAMIESCPPDTPIWMDPLMVYDRIDDWILNPQKQTEFNQWAKNLPIASIDNISTGDQYPKNEAEPASLVNSLLSYRNKFLFEIVFETMTRGICFVPTEKTLRTIVAEKPMLVYAAPNFLTNLKKLGFKTFDILWDESYDALEGPPRYHAMMAIVQSVCEMSRNQQLELYAQSRNICQHNRQQLIYLKRNALYKPG